jgi:hypothetical protein
MPPNSGSLRSPAKERIRRVPANSKPAFCIYANRAGRRPPARVFEITRINFLQTVVPGINVSSQFFPKNTDVFIYNIISRLCSILEIVKKHVIIYLPFGRLCLTINSKLNNGALL